MYARYESARTRPNAWRAIGCWCWSRRSRGGDCLRHHELHEPHGHHDHRRTGFVPQRHCGRYVNGTHRRWA